MTKRPKRLTAVLADAHDRADKLRDDLRRDLVPRYPPDDPDAGQIMDLADQLANCLKVERALKDGYPGEPQP